MAGIVLPDTLLDPTVGGDITSTWADGLNTAIDYLARDKPSCRVFNAGDVSMANTTSTAMTWDSEAFDTGGMHSTSSNLSRITFTDPGRYMVGCDLVWAVSGAGTRFGSIQLNGATNITGIGPVNGHAALFVHCSVSTIYSFAAGDYIEAVAYQDSGGALFCKGIGYFYAIWMGL